MSEKLVAERLVKVFGDDPDRAVRLLEDGKSKADILTATGMTVGVSGVDFSVREGEIFVVMGLSGSGKSTLIRMINRLIEPSSGNIIIDGDSITDADEDALRTFRRDKLAMVFQHFALFPHRSVRENVEFGLKTRGVEPGKRRVRALEMLDQVGLGAWAEAAPSALSGGMQQRVGLARALAVDPEILLMDEPFSALDPLIRADMQGELVALQDKLKKTIVFITHDLNEALILGDRIAIMEEGHFVQVGTAEQIVSEPASDYVAAFTQDIDRGRVFTAGSVMVPPEALDLATDTSQTALERMERLGRDALYVQQDGRIAGAVRYRDLAAAARGNGADLRAQIITDYPTTAPDTHLYRMFRLCASGLPVAVLDRDGRLAGVVEPESVFNQLAARADAGAATADTRLQA